MTRTTSRRLLWALLALPAAWFAVDAAGRDPVGLEELLHPTGELSARLLIVALALTPLARLLPHARPVRWLVANRRAFGLAAFGYAAMHALFYVVAMGSAADMLAELDAPGIWTGWAALALLTPLALTSNDAAQRRMRAAWKRLQRLAYPAALLTLAHWLLVHNSVIAAAAHFAPLAILQILRIARFTRAAPASSQRSFHA